VTALPMPEGQTPHRWQEEALEAVGWGLRRWPSVLVEAATGAGKGTFLVGLAAVMAAQAKAAWGRGPDAKADAVLIIVGAEQLVDDLAARARALGVDVGVYKGRSKELGHAVTVATVQAAQKADPGVFGVVRYLIIDEAHHAPAPGYKKLREALAARWTVGLTATPFRADAGFEAGLGSTFAATVYSYPMAKAAKDGIVAPVEVRRLVTGSMLREADLADDEALEKAVNTEGRNALIVDRWLSDGGGARCWAYGAGVAHAEALAEVMRGRGLRALAVHGVKSPRAALDAFNAGELDVLVSASKLREGVDGRVMGVLMAAPVRTLGGWMQIVGRGTRMGPWRGGAPCTVWEGADTIEGFAEVATSEALRGLEGMEVKPGELRIGDRVEHRHDSALKDGNVLAVDGELVTVAWLGVGSQPHHRLDLRRARPVVLDGVEMAPRSVGRLETGASFTLVTAAEAPSLSWYRYAESAGGVRLTALLDIGSGQSKGLQVSKEGPGAWMALAQAQRGDKPTLVARRVGLVEALKAAEAWAARTGLRSVDLGKAWAARPASERQREALAKWGLKRFSRADVSVGEASLLISTVALRAAAKEVT